MFKVFIIMIKVINCFILLQNHISIHFISDSNVIKTLILIGSKRPSDVRVTQSISPSDVRVTPSHI